jgi:hypothetical protein
MLQGKLKPATEWKLVNKDLSVWLENKNNLKWMFILHG